MVLFAFWIFLFGATKVVTGELYECPTTESLSGKTFSGTILGQNQGLSTEDNNNCYILLKDQKRTWDLARTACEDLAVSYSLQRSRGSLAIVDTAEKQALIEEKLQALYQEGKLSGFDRYFLGGKNLVNFQEAIDAGTFSNQQTDSLYPKWRLFSECKACEYLKGQQNLGNNNGLLGIQGCYWMTRNQRVLVPDLLPENVTLEACEGRCRDANYPYYALHTEVSFGTGDVSLCYCLFDDWASDPDGLSTAYDTVTGANNNGHKYCNAACSGDSSQYCGGVAYRIANADVYPETVGVVDGIAGPSVISDSLWDTQEPSYFARNQDCAVVNLATERLEDEFCFGNINGGPFPFICETNFKTGSTCKSGHYKVAGTCLFIASDSAKVNWYEAKQKCIELRGDLWFPKNLESDIAELKSKTGRTTGSLYVGAIARAWLWNDMSTLSYSNFDDEQPNGGGYDTSRCMVMRENPNGQNRYPWRDTPCNSMYYSMCQLEIKEDTEDQCASNPCANGGTCTDGIVSYTCECKPGYNGNRCQNNIDDCDPDPCANSAVCKDGVNTFTCECPDGFTGQTCLVNVDECKSNPCQHGGLCRDGPNGYTCDCAAGYEGTSCQTDMDECLLFPCFNDGNCTDGINSRVCKCAVGFEGPDCLDNINECASGPCVNGICRDEIGDYTCECFTQKWGSKNCDLDLSDCNEFPCEHQGFCIEHDNQPRTCICLPGYTGDNCEINIDDCISFPCLNGGTCSDLTEFPNRRVCSCPEGYEGFSCENEVDFCRTQPCQNSAECVGTLEGRTCNCAAGYTGENCQTNIDECKPNPCQNNGNCTDGVASYTCDCPTGFSGRNCQTKITTTTTTVQTTTAKQAATSNNGNNSNTDPSLGASTDDSSGLGTFEIALIIILVILVIAIIIAIIIFCCYKNKNGGKNKRVGAYYDGRPDASLAAQEEVYIPPSVTSSKSGLLSDQSVYSTNMRQSNNTYQSPKPRISINDYY